MNTDTVGDSQASSVCLAASLRDFGRVARERTSRVLSRAMRRIADPRAAYERTVRRIVAERLPRTREEVLGSDAAPPEPAPGFASPPRRPGDGAAVALSVEPPSWTPDGSDGNGLGRRNRFGRRDGSPGTSD